MITILDGAMGGELIRRQVTPRGELWSAQALIDDPNSVLQVHRDYLAAQARPIYRSLCRSLDPFVDLFLCETMSCIRESVSAATAAREIADPGKPVYVSWTLPRGPEKDCAVVKPFRPQWNPWPIST